MNFLNPLFLLGLLAVAIPVMLHFINLRRPRKVSFSTLSFFNELRQSTIRRMRLKQYLLMALRALAVLLLAAAVARPFLPPTLFGSLNSGESAAIAVIIDNSASMDRIGQQGPLIDQAKDIALQLIQQRESSEKRYLILQTNGESTNLSFIDSENAEEHIHNIEAENKGHYTREAIQQAYNRLQLSPLPQGMIYLISDGQESQLEDLEKMNMDQEAAEEKDIALQLITLEDSRQQNLAVTSLDVQSQMLSQHSTITIAVEVQNTGNAAAANQYISLEIEGEVIGQYEVALQPGDVQELLFDFTPDHTGDVAGRVLIEGDEVDFDNNRYFVVRVPEQRSILVLHSDEQTSSFSSYLYPALEAAHEMSSHMTFSRKEISDGETVQWSKYDAIVIDGVNEIPEYLFEDMQQFVQEGKGILFFPSEEGAISNYNRFFDLFNGGSYNSIIGNYASFNTVVHLGDLEEGHPVLNNLFLLEEDERISVEKPSIFYYYNYQHPNQSGALTILQAANGDPLLAEHQFGEGKFLVSALGADPGWSNFPVNPLFAPVYYRSILYASQSDKGGLQEHELGETLLWESSADISEAHLKINDIETIADIQQGINEVRIVSETHDWRPGWLTIETAENLFQIGINQDIMESMFTALEQEQWQELVKGTFNQSEVIKADELSSKSLSEELQTAVFGKEIWDWFVWLALLFLIAETLVSRIYRVESLSSYD